MSQAKNEKKTENDDALRRFIDRLENWPEDNPPSPAELRALRREIHLTVDDREKLELLAENHIRRARKALSDSAYDQAAAELARASQLRPMDARPRIELAEIYLQRSLERGYGRNDRQRALKLAHKALELNPGDIEAKRFLHEYRRMNADFMAVKYKRLIIPSAILVVLLAAMIWWQRDWVINLFTQQDAISVPVSSSQFSTAIPADRYIDVDSSAINLGNLETEILSASVGRRNDDSYVSVLGRLRVSDKNLGKLKLLVRGRDKAGNAVFTIPWNVRNDSDPVLIPGDSETLALFRWLAEPETSIESLEIIPYEISEPESSSRWETVIPEIIWGSPRPEGSSISSEIRNFRTIEAYDRQILLMDMAVENTGITELSLLTLEVSLGSDLVKYTENTIGNETLPMKKGERRVQSIAMGIPLDSDLSGRPVTVTVKDIGVNH